jgi:ABC-type multidrug transport system fused ATPase/permease subunit
MSQVLLIDIFFIVSILSIAVVSIATTTLLVYRILIIRDQWRVVNRVRREAVETLNHLGALRDSFFEDKDRIFELALYGMDILRSFNENRQASTKRTARKKASKRASRKTVSK